LAGRTDIGDRCEQGVLPEVVGLPPCDLIEQVRVGPAAQCCRYEDRVLELLVLPVTECAIGQEPLPDPLQSQRVSAISTAPVKRVGGEAKEDLAGEGVVSRMQRRERAQQLEDVCVACQPVEQDLAGGSRVLRVGPFSWQAYPDGRAEPPPGWSEVGEVVEWPGVVTSAGTRGVTAT
jgi:hypothetical protein